MLLPYVERHLRRTRTPPSRFGRDALGDPSFVKRLRNGSEPRPQTLARVLSYIVRCERALPAEETGRWTGGASRRARRST